MSTDEGLETKGKTTVDLRNQLTSHFNSNQDRLDKLSTMPLSIDVSPPSPNLQIGNDPDAGTSTSNSTSNFNANANINDAFTDLASAIRSCIPKTNTLGAVLDTLRARKIHFSGTENFMEFINSFNSICTLYNVQDNEKNILIHDIVEKEPLMLLKANSDCLVTWDKTFKLLNDVYHHPISEKDKKLQLYQRTQSMNEGIIIYISALKALNKRLEHSLDDNEFLNLAKDNVNPFYYQIVEDNDPQTLDDLIECCRILEKRRERRKTFHLPPKNMINNKESPTPFNKEAKIYMLDESECVSPTNEIAINFAGKIEKHQKPKPISNKTVATQTNESYRPCYRCGSLTHLVSSCTKQSKTTNTDTQDFVKQK